MIYEKRSWIPDEIISADKLNNIENGIESVTSGSNVLQDEIDTLSNIISINLMHNDIQKNLYPGAADWSGSWTASNPNSTYLSNETHDGYPVIAMAQSEAKYFKLLNIAEAGKQYTFQCWIKTADASDIRMYIKDSDNASATAIFDSVVRTFTNISNNTWTKITGTYNCTVSGAMNPFVTSGKNDTLFIAQYILVEGDTVINLIDTVIAQNYDDMTFPIAKGSLVIHNDQLYMADTNISSSEDWNSSHWDKTTVAEGYAQLKDDIDEHYGGGMTSFALESGSLSSTTGEEYSRTDRIRTVDYIDLSEYEGSVTIPEDHAIIPAYYNSNKVWQENGSWLTECSVSDFENYPYVRFVIRNNQHLNDDISDEVGTIVFGMNLKNKSNAQLYEDTKTLYNSVDLLNAPLEVNGLAQVGRLGWEVYSSSTPPEQSIPSYCLAYKNGCRVMLADIQVTSDGKYVCFHDLTLGDDPSTSNPVRHPDGTQLTAEEKALHIYELTLAELDEFDFGIKKGSQYAGTKILRLEDFLKWCKVMGCTAMLETKVTFSAVQAGEIADMIVKYGLDKNVIWAENAYQSSWGGITFPVITQRLPNAIIHVRGGSNNYQNALAFAQQYATAAKHTELSFTNTDHLTEEVLSLLNESNIDVAFSEVKSVSQLDDMVESGLIYRIKSVACSYVNIGKYFADKYL